MNESLHNSDLVLAPLDNERLANLCGPLDEHLRQLERRMGVEINNRGNSFSISGDEYSVKVTRQLINDLYDSTSRETLSPERVHLFLQEANINEEKENRDNEVIVKVKRAHIRGRTPNQRRYLKNIQYNDINFGIGPAGTGKTYLAVACAVAALEQDRARRIVLVRPSR